jgi:predicted amidohydrolase YtcJ
MHCPNYPIKMRKKIIVEATLGFINGNIITMKDKKIQEAVAVSNDRIVGVGTNREILAMTNKMTHIIDLK